MSPYRVPGIMPANKELEPDFYFKVKKWLTNNRKKFPSYIVSCCLIFADFLIFICGLITADTITTLEERDFYYSLLILTYNMLFTLAAFSICMGISEIIDENKRRY